MRLGNLAIDSRCFDYTVPASGDGFSRDAEWLKDNLGKVLNDLRKPVTGLPREVILKELKDTFDECSSENWDGYNAKPLSVEAYNEAKQILESLLITSMPLPEIVPEPSGSIGLEWYRDKKHIFIISLAGNKTITYAGIFGEGDRDRGTESFAKDLPSKTRWFLRRLYPRS